MRYIFVLSIRHNKTKTNIMTTLTILLKAAKKEASIRVWGLAQRNISKIGFDGLEKVQIQLRETNPNFFVPKSMQ